MKKIFLILSLGVSVFATSYVVNKGKSSINFDATKFMFVGVQGHFYDFNATINVDENNKLSRLEGLIGIDSIDTADKKRDAHLKAQDYFDMQNHPTIVVNSQKIDAKILLANIQIKGIKKEIPFKISNLVVKKEFVSFTLSSVVDRQDFSLNGSMSGVISDNVDVIAHIIAFRK